MRFYEIKKSKGKQGYDTKEEIQVANKMWKIALFVFRELWIRTIIYTFFVSTNWQSTKNTVLFNFEGWML